MRWFQNLKTWFPFNYLGAYSEFCLLREWIFKKVSVFPDINSLNWIFIRRWTDRDADADADTRTDRCEHTFINGDKSIEVFRRHTYIQSNFLVDFRTFKELVQNFLWKMKVVFVSERFKSEISAQSHENWQSYSCLSWVPPLNFENAAPPHLNSYSLLKVFPSQTVEWSGPFDMDSTKATVYQGI